MCQEQKSLAFPLGTVTIFFLPLQRSKLTCQVDLGYRPTTLHTHHLFALNVGQEDYAQAFLFSAVFSVASTLTDGP
jgi:hypothetical protein